MAFALLSTWSARLPRGKYLPFQLGHELIRFGALGAGVLFLLALLAAALPLVLDFLERRGFVSFVGARQVRATKSGFLTVISVLSIAGVGVSSCALCSVTSIMGGFGQDLKQKILGNNAHVVLDGAAPGGLERWQPLLEDAQKALVPFRGSVTPVVAGDAMASSASNTAGALVRGVDPASIGSVIALRENLECGSLDYLAHPEKLLSLGPNEIIGRGPSGEAYFRGADLPLPDIEPGLGPRVKEEVALYPGVLLGRELARSLHVLVGDEVTLLSPMGELGPTGVMPRARKFRVAGIFFSGMYEYDASFAYVTLDVAQSFFSMGDKISELDVHLPDPEHMEAPRAALQALVATGAGGVGGSAVASRRPPASLRARDWVEMNRNLFSALALEKIATFIILSIAIAVASFCIVCTLLLMVTEKRREIAVLKALGASDGSILRIFVLEGTVIGAIGTVFGVGTALATCTGLSYFGVRLDPEVYYIDRLPVNVNAADYALVALAAMVICTLATLYPARAASKLPPVDGLRHE